MWAWASAPAAALLLGGATPIALTPDVAVATTSAPTATIALGALSLTPSPADATSSAPTATVGLGALAVTPDVAVATTSAPTATVALGAIGLEPGAADATSSAPTATLSIGALAVEPATAAATTSALDPGLALGAVALTPGPATATTSVLVGAVDFPVAGAEDWTGELGDGDGAYRYEGAPYGLPFGDYDYEGTIEGDDYEGGLGDGDGLYRYEGELGLAEGDDMATFSMVVGDRAPALTRVLRNSLARVPVDLTTASGVTVEFKIRAADGTFGTLKTGTATFAADATGVATYAWAVDDVDEAGTMMIRFIATFPTAKDQHFPSDGTWLEFPVSE